MIKVCGILLLSESQCKEGQGMVLRDAHKDRNMRLIFL